MRGLHAAVTEFGIMVADLKHILLQITLLYMKPVHYQ